MLGLGEVSILYEVCDGEEDEEGGDVETPEEQPVDLVVEHLVDCPTQLTLIFMILSLYLCLCFMTNEK